MHRLSSGQFIVKSRGRIVVTTIQMNKLYTTKGIVQHATYTLTYLLTYLLIYLPGGWMGGVVAQR